MWAEHTTEIAVILELHMNCLHPNLSLNTEDAESKNEEAERASENKSKVPQAIVQLAIVMRTWNLNPFGKRKVVAWFLIIRR